MIRSEAAVDLGALAPHGHAEWILAGLRWRNTRCCPDVTCSIYLVAADGKTFRQLPRPALLGDDRGFARYAGCAAVINGTEQVNLLGAIQLGINAPVLFAGYASTAKAARMRKLQPKRKKGAAFMAQVAPSAPPPATTWQRITDLRSWN